MQQFAVGVEQVVGPRVAAQLEEAIVAHADVVQALVQVATGCLAVEAGDKRDGTDFTPGDLQLLRIVAAQVSPLIENAALVQQSNRRAQRAETLRRIASLTGSAATQDEMLKYSLLDLVRLLQAEVGAILLFDAERGELRPHWASLYGIEQHQLPQLRLLSLEKSESLQMVSGAVIHQR